MYILGNVWKDNVNVRIIATADTVFKCPLISLKGNELTKLPVYLLNNALEKNSLASALYLSENPWRCECNFMLRFQVNFTFRFTSVHFSII